MGSPSLIDSLGGRKFLLTLLTLAIGTAVQILSPLGVTTEFAALLVGLTTAFGAANAVITATATNAEGTTPAQVDTTELDGQITLVRDFAVQLDGKVMDLTGKVDQVAASLLKVAEANENTRKVLTAVMKLPQ